MNGAIDIESDITAREHNFWGLLTLRTCAPFIVPEGSSMHQTDTEGCFVNSGMHQIPLFEGVPPEFIFREDDPMGALVSKLAKLGKANTNIIDDGGGCCSGGSAIPPSATSLILSNGASAIIRLQDGRLEGVAAKHMSEDPGIYPNEKLLQDFFKSYPPGAQRSMISLFKYDALRNAEDPSLEALLPRNVPRDALMFAINELFEKEGRKLLDSVK